MIALHWEKFIQRIVEKYNRIYKRGKVHAIQTTVTDTGVGISEEFNELVGGSFEGIVHPDDYERAEKEIWHQIDNGDTGLDQVKYRTIKKDGSVINIADYGRLVRDKEVGDIFYVFVAEIPGGNL